MRPRDGSHGQLLAGERASPGLPSGDVPLTKRLDDVAKLRQRRRKDRHRPATVEERAAWFARRRGARKRLETQRLLAVAAGQGDGVPVREDAAHRRWLYREWQQLQRRRRDAVRRAGWRLRNWMRHAHYDAIRFLTDGWDIVVRSTVGPDSRRRRRRGYDGDSRDSCDARTARSQP